MRPPLSAPARAAVRLYRQAPIAARLHVLVRWWTCPVPAVAAEIPARGRVLEVGCGHGLVSAYLAMESPDRVVVGVDVDRRKIDVAAAATAGVDNVRFVAVDADPSSLPAGPFDAVVIADVLYLLGGDARRRLLAACAERLGPAAVLVIKEIDTEPSWKHRLARVQELAATRLLRITVGDEVEFAPPAVLRAELGRFRLDVADRRIDRGYPHPHHLLVARP
ncbi:MAG: class I SAM-dependent methyltransferase [Acidimicrobiales bacterium]